MLNENVKKYLALKQEIESKKTDLDALKDEILKEMGTDLEFTADDGTKATITLKEKYDYTDETAMINWLESHGYGQYVVKAVDTRKMNKELKKGATLTESLKTMYKKTETKALSVSKEEE